MKMDLTLITAEGEGQKTEFKERLSRLDREMVAFANASGGTIFLGVADNGQIRGVEITNEQAVARIGHPGSDGVLPISGGNDRE